MILVEFAVNPDVIEEWSDLKMITLIFGFHNGAVISFFPKTWIRDLKERAKNELEGTRKFSEVIERIDVIKNGYLVKRNRPFDFDKSWMVNAIYQHKKSPFYCIVDCENSNEVPEQMAFKDIDFPVFNNLREGVIKRKAKDLAEEARLLLECSKKIKIIDPYCSADNCYRKTVGELLKIAIMQNRSPNVYFEIHTSSIRSGMAVNIKEEKKAFLDTFPAIIPKGNSIQIYWWDDPNTKEIHPRYLISARGGIRYDRGFNEPYDFAVKDSETDVSVMTSAMTDRVWNKYTESISKYDLVDQVEISGQMIIS